MAETERVSNLPPPLVALAGWFVPGAGYMLIGQRARGAVVFFGIVAMYILGLLIGGVRVIEVPGYHSQSGMQIRWARGRIVEPGDSNYPTADWAMTSRGFLTEIANKPWFVGQILAGPICLGSSARSVSLAQESWEEQSKWEQQKAREARENPKAREDPKAREELKARGDQIGRDHARYPRPHGPSETVATLYTAIAGMLNLMVMIDAAHRAGQPREAQ